MKHVLLLIPVEDIVVCSIEGPHKVPRQVNDLLLGAELVGVRHESSLNGGLFRCQVVSHGI